MALKLKIGRTLDVPVKFSLRDGAREASFAFTLVVRRLARQEAADLLERLKLENKDRDAVEDAELTRATLADLVSDWRGQRLVVDDDDQPAPFSAEALDLMLESVGVGQELLTPCLKAVFDGARTEAEDRRKN